MSRAIVPEWAITLTQPWATLMALDEKRCETRSWGTFRRGRIAIHAAKGFPREAKDLCTASPFRQTLAKHDYTSAAQLPTSAIIATTDLYRCDQFHGGTTEWMQRFQADGSIPEHELQFGDYTPGRYGFYTRDVVRLRVVVPARGALGFWRIPEDVRRLLATALEHHAA